MTFLGFSRSPTNQQKPTNKWDREGSSCSKLENGGQVAGAREEEWTGLEYLGGESGREERETWSAVVQPPSSFSSFALKKKAGTEFGLAAAADMTVNKDHLRFP